MPVRLLFCGFFCLLLVGCGSSSYPELETADGAIPIEAVEETRVGIAAGEDGYLYLTGSTGERSYTLDSGDRVRVDVFGQPNLSRVVSVDGGGFVSLPLIGAVKARGHSTFSLGSMIARRLGQRYVRNPKVTVEISRYRPFFILGEVRNPGKFPYENGMTVRTAVAIAGGYTPRANEMDAKVTRKIRGRSVTVTVPFSYEVKPGDTVYVVERLL